MSQTNYSVDSIKYITGQIADTSLKQIDSFQLVNKSANVRSYARPGDVVIRTVQGTASTSQVVLRGEAVADLAAGINANTSKVIGIVAYDDSYGLEFYQSKLAADVESNVIYRGVMNVIRKGRIAVRVAVAVIAGNPAFPVPITAAFDTSGTTYRNDNSEQATLLPIGVFVTSAAVGELAIIEINCTN